MLLGVAALAAALALQVNVAPRALAAYIERRAYGHDRLIEAGANRTADLLRRADRGVLEPRLRVPAWAGAHPAEPADVAPVAEGRAVLASSSDELVAALEAARPGDVITLAPGTYRFEGRSLPANRPGRPEAPITVRASALGLVRLEFAILEGFHVTAPHWHFENLEIRGVCPRHDDCEHAFHVV